MTKIALQGDTWLELFDAVRYARDEHGSYTFVRVDCSDHGYGCLLIEGTHFYSAEVAGSRLVPVFPEGEVTDGPVVGTHDECGGQVYERLVDDIATRQCALCKRFVSYENVAIYGQPPVALADTTA